MTFSPTATETREQRKAKVLSVDFNGETTFWDRSDVMDRPLKSYDNGKRNLSEMVWEKWREANRQILDTYNHETRAILKNQNPSATPLALEVQSYKIGDLAHRYIQEREAQNQDFAWQSQLAALYVRRQNRSLPRLKKAERIIRNLFLISAMASAALVLGRGKSFAVQGGAIMAGLSAMAVMVVAAEERRVHHQCIRIKSNLLSWHKMTNQNKNALYDEIMKPAHMGLCGLVETFYKTR